MSEALPSQYEEERWCLPKDAILAARDAIECGIEHAKEALAVHDSNLGRTTRKNASWANQIEEDIQQMQAALKGLGVMQDAD